MKRSSRHEGLAEFSNLVLETRRPNLVIGSGQSTKQQKSEDVRRQVVGDEVEVSEERLEGDGERGMAGATLPYVQFGD